MKIELLIRMRLVHLQKALSLQQARREDTSAMITKAKIDELRWVIDEG